MLLHPRSRLSSQHSRLSQGGRGLALQLAFAGELNLKRRARTGAATVGAHVAAAAWPAVGGGMNGGTAAQR